MRPWIAVFLPAPSMMVVLSLDTMTFFAVPRSAIVVPSRLPPVASVTGAAPVSTPMSSIIALRRSPKPGALTATHGNEPRRRFTTSVARASPSTSSAMITSGRPDWATCSSSGIMSLMDEIFFSCTRM